MNSLTVVFRSDASLEIGIGHVMRCLTLADALKGNDARCIFVCREHAGNLLELIRSRGFEAHGLSVDLGFNPTSVPGDGNRSEYAGWLGSTVEADAQQTLGVLSDSGICMDWLIVDHYAIDDRWEKYLRPATKRLMAIDDLADRHHDCDLLLDQNLGREKTDYANIVPDACKVLAGPGFALIRPEFSKLRKSGLNRRSATEVRQVLVAMGGVDRDNVTRTVLDAIKSVPFFRQCKIIIVMGRDAPWIGQVRQFAGELQMKAEVRVDVSNMAELMVASDLAIGAAGSTSWERCCLGVPTILAVLADNQRSIALNLQKAGAARIFDPNEGEVNLSQLLSEIVGSVEILKKMSEAGRSVVDGHGTARVVSSLVTSNIT